jgi:hypothetical protein
MLSKYVGFEDLTAAFKISFIFWITTPSSPLEFRDYTALYSRICWKKLEHAVA